MHRDGPCPLIRIMQLRNAGAVLLYFNAGTYKQSGLPGGAVQTDRSNAIAYLLREKPDTTQHPAARRLGLRPVQCDREFKEIGKRKPTGCLPIPLCHCAHCHLASFTAPGFSVSSFVFSLLALYLLVVSQAAKIIRDRTKCLLV
jgi:hypothetical protein